MVVVVVVVVQSHLHKRDNFWETSTGFTGCWPGYGGGCLMQRQFISEND